MTRALLVALLVAGCGGSDPGTGTVGDGGSGGTGGGDAECWKPHGPCAGSVPTIKITSPVPSKNPVAVKLAADGSVDVHFTTTGFTLKDPTAGGDPCGDDPHCGFVSVSVDVDACPTPGKYDYNNWGFANPVKALMKSCVFEEGVHLVTLTLQWGLANPATNNQGFHISDAVWIDSAK